MDYLDFCLKVTAVDRGSYRTQVLSSPAGQAGAPFSLSTPPSGLDALLDNLASRSVPPVSARDLAWASAVIQESDPRRLGDWLFGNLFQGAVRACYDESCGIARAQAYGLRIKLHFDPEARETDWLNLLPWESLYRSDTGDFLALNRRSPIVRHLEVPQPQVPLPVRPPLRIAVVAGPPGSCPLDLDREYRELKAAWQPPISVDITLLGEPTTEALRRQLLDRRFHILHYMGHGSFDARARHGGIEFGQPPGAAITVEGEVLRQLLQGVESLRLVVLNACASGHHAGIGPALVVGGVPAVVGMQLPISDTAAILFSRILYQRLGSGDPLEAAVTEARLALHVARPEAVDWVTPILFMRSADGELLAESWQKSVHRKVARELIVAITESYLVNYEPDQLPALYEYLRLMSLDLRTVVPPPNADRFDAVSLGEGFLAPLLLGVVAGTVGHLRRASRPWAVRGRRALSAGEMIDLAQLRRALPVKAKVVRGLVQTLSPNEAALALTEQIVRFTFGCLAVDAMPYQGNA